MNNNAKFGLKVQQKKLDWMCKMATFAIYGKRTGLIVNGVPIYDKQFRALDYRGIRVSKLEQAGTYATKEDAQKVVDEKCKDYKDAGLAEYQVRSIK